MSFSVFIRDNLEAITDEWEAFARTLLPTADTMSTLALRDHSRQILLAVADDMETRETEGERSTKAKGMAPPQHEADTAATEHGTVRHLSGFDPVQLVSEFRAMRASVLALWKRRQADDGGPAGTPEIEEIVRFNESIDQAIAESVASYSTAVATSRDMFLAVLGHDLRGPLAAIGMTAKVLAKPELTQKSRHDAALRIQRALAAMNRLIVDLLDYTRASLGTGIPIERSACDLRAICDEVLETIRAAHPEQTFDTRLSGDLMLAADAPRLQQMLSNLLNNAVQHGDRSAPVSLHAEGRADEIELRVANTGRPIPPGALQTIFEPLVQAPSTDADAHEPSKTSLGLGLFIVREIVLGHGGRITVQSSADAGTVFTIRLPRVVG